MSTVAPEQTGFELDRFHWPAADRLEVEGRWFGVRGRRFVRPVLTVHVRGRRKRLLASLEHKPWTADEGELWLAVFPWTGSQDDVGEAELAVGALTVDLPAPGAPTRMGGRPEPVIAKQKPAEKSATKPRSRSTKAPETSKERAEAPVVRRTAVRTRQQLERDLAGTAAEMERLQARADTAQTQIRAATERAREADDEAARLRTELEVASVAEEKLVLLREAEAAAREDAKRERQEADEARAEAERHEQAASNAAAEAERAGAEKAEAAAEAERARAEAAEMAKEAERVRAQAEKASAEAKKEADKARAEAAEALAELERLREEAAGAEALREEAERLREEAREAAAEIQKLRQVSRRATAEAERLRAAGRRPGAQVTRRAPAATPPEPVAETAPPEPVAETAPPEPVAEAPAPPEPAPPQFELADPARPDPRSKGARRVIPRDPEATAGMDTLDEATREAGMPPPTVRRIPPRGPAEGVRPDPVVVARPVAGQHLPLVARPGAQVWGTRVVVVGLLLLLVLALALIIAGVI